MQDPTGPPAGAVDTHAEFDVAHGIDPEVFRRRWWTLSVLCLSLLIIMIGNTSLNVALPSLSEQLNATTAELQWMVDAYAGRIVNLHPSLLPRHGKYFHLR